MTKGPQALALYGSERAHNHSKSEQTFLERKFITKMRQICQIRSGLKIDDWNPLLKKIFREILYNFLQFSLMSWLISGKDNSFWSVAI